LTKKERIEATFWKLKFHRDPVVFAKALFAPHFKSPPSDFAEKNMTVVAQPRIPRLLRSFNFRTVQVQTLRHYAIAQKVIDSFLSNEDNPALLPIESTDYLSPAQSHLLSLTLQPYLPFTLEKSEDYLPKGHHLVYFPTAAVHESRLDVDGTETTYNPGSPFNRRMWAGGRIEWPKDIRLNFCCPTTEKMELDQIEAKQRSNGSEMIVMSVRKVLTQNDLEVMRETRQWVFLKDGDPSASESSAKRKPALESRKKIFQHSVNLTPAALFRYSALIFNSHAIHLSKEHCLKEGHPNLVVHGPLTLSLLLEAVRETYKGKNWKAIEYRAVGPAYVGDAIELAVGFEKDGKIEAWAEKGDGIQVIMTVSVDLR
jgi:hydroxyacyl-ACP dehydratase HTD2-like protein with hotdog domain